MFTFTVFKLLIERTVTAVLKWSYKSQEAQSLMGHEAPLKGMAQKTKVKNMVLSTCPRGSL